MKKVIISHTNYKTFGGEDANYLTESKFLIENYKVINLTFNNYEKLNIYDFISFFNNSNIESNRKLKNILKEQEVDLIYFHNLWFKGNLGLLKIAKNNNLKIVIKIHNFRYMCASTFSSNKHAEKNNVCNACNFKGRGKFKFNKYYENSYTRSFFVIWHTKKFLKILKKYPSQIFIVSDLHKKYIEKLNIDPSRITKFYNPIIKPKKISEYNPSSNYVVFAGRITEEKGIYELIDVWKQFDNKGIKLKIIGKYSLDNINLKTIFTSNTNIELLGELSLEDTITQINKARALIMPTKLFEGQPRVLCEASIMGVPSIFPNSGSIVEFFPDNYILKYKQFDYRDLLFKLSFLHDEERLLKISKIVSNFSSEQLSNDFLMEKFNAVFYE